MEKGREMKRKQESVWKVVMDVDAVGHQGECVNGLQLLHPDRGDYVQERVWVLFVFVIILVGAFIRIVSSKAVIRFDF